MSRLSYSQISENRYSRKVVNLNDKLPHRASSGNKNSNISSEKQVISGVIQGSILGPLLFIIHVNDMDHVFKYCVHLNYGDDIRIYHCFKSNPTNQSESSRLFQSDIESLMAWSIRWDLKFEISKFCILHFDR